MVELREKLSSLSSDELAGAAVELLRELEAAPTKSGLAENARSESASEQEFDFRAPSAGARRNADLSAISEYFARAERCYDTGFELF